jgi:L,D-peptidoglycan transpeptidase YkuD (ErfK/YbiS/YcfS/YnhG family)
VGTALPLALPTGPATEVITVVAASTTQTTATLQAWRKGPQGWTRVGPAVPAELGNAGMTEQPSEANSATPMGSFTLTQAFGRDTNPGTALPYLQTDPDDWWISQPGPLYNTHQRCAADCAFTQGAPNEHLYYETPFYDYAVVIDYNTSNAGPVVQGAGSAFFLHVSVGVPTAGCVSIDPTDLVRVLQWLRPADHPRILIGLGT